MRGSASKSAGSWGKEGCDGGGGDVDDWICAMLVGFEETQRRARNLEKRRTPRTVKLCGRGFLGIPEGARYLTGSKQQQCYASRMSNRMK